MDKKILIVDDDPMNLKVVCRLLKDTCYTADTASGGADALVLTQQNQYDTILTDHLMPGMDGIELFKNIKSQDGGQNRTVPIVVLTGNAGPDAAKEYEEVGFNGYLEKPVNRGALLDMLDKVMSGEGGAPKTDSSASTQTDASSAASPAVSADAWYMHIEGIDGKVAISTIGSEETLRSVMKLYYDSLTDKYNEIDGYFKAQDWTNYTIKVHALKSSSKLIGALSISEQAALLEDAGKQGNIDYIRSKHDAFMADYLGVREPLGRIFNADEQMVKKKPVADRNLLESVYDVIKGAAMAEDSDSIEEALDELNEYEVPQNIERTLKMIRFKASGLDFDGVLGMIDQIR